MTRTEERMQRAASATPQRAANRRTAAILLAIVVVLFGGIMLEQASGAPGVAIAVLGFAILGFLAVTIRRRSKRRGSA